MRFYAVFDLAAETESAREQPRNVFIVEDQADPVALVVLDHTAQRWVHNPALIAFVAGDRAAECREITAAEAQELVGGWGAHLPSYDEVRALAR